LLAAGAPAVAMPKAPPAGAGARPAEAPAAATLHRLDAGDMDEDEETPALLPAQAEAIRLSLASATPSAANAASGPQLAAGETFA
jgi:hypothetical protein